MAEITPDERLRADVNIDSSSLSVSQLPVEWPQSLSLDYIFRGEQSNDIVNRANQAANGAFQAQVYAQENRVLITEVTERVDTLETRVDTLESDLDALTNRVDSLEQNPYGSLRNTAQTTLTVAANSSEDATYNGTIAGRGVSLENNRISPNGNGVFRISAILDFSSTVEFTAKIMLDTTELFSFTGMSVSEVIPGFDMPITSTQELYVSIENNTGSGITVNLNANNYLNISRQGL